MSLIQVFLTTLFQLRVKLQSSAPVHWTLHSIQGSWVGLQVGVGISVSYT